MGLFNLRWKSEIKPDTLKTEVTARATISRNSDLTSHIEYEITKKVLNDLADKITNAIYDDILVEIEKDLIVREVSLKVSDNIIEKLFRKEAKK